MILHVQKFRVGGWVRNESLSPAKEASLSFSSSISKHGATVFVSGPA